MRRLGLIALVIFAAGTTTRPARAQGVFDQVKKQADAAKKAADQIKRKADSTANAAAKARAATDSAKTAADNAKTSVGNAANTITTGGGTSTTAPSSGAKPAQAAQPKNARGSAPAASTPSGPQGLSRTAAHVEEEVLFAGEAGTTFGISPRGQHLAARTLKGSRTVMIYDGVAGPPFDEIPNGIGQGVFAGAFSDDGAHYAYVGRQGQQWVVMLDGKELSRGAPVWQNNNPTTPTIELIGFTHGAKHFYFSTADIPHRKFQFFVDGKPDPMIQDHVRPVFSPDGEHYAYEFPVNVETGNPLPALMVDGKRAAYAGAHPQFTSDGLHLYTQVDRAAAGVDVYLDGKPIMHGNAALHMTPTGSGMLATVFAVAPTGEHYTFLTIGTKRVPNSECRGSGEDVVYFSADVKHWAVKCEDSSTSNWIMTDGKKGQEYQRVGSDAVLFTTDGRPVYMAMANNRQLIVVGDQEFGPYAGGLILQPPPGVNNLRGVVAVPVIVAGNHFGFIASESNGFTLNRTVVVDGKVTKTVNASDLGFSPDGSHFAYIEGQSPRAVVLDGVKRTPAIFSHDPADVPAAFVFSQDGQHLAFASAQGNGKGLAVAIDDGIFASDASSTRNITFTPDGKHLMWLGGRPGNRWGVYVDGQPVLESDQPAGPEESVETWWSMGADGVLTFVAQDGGVLKRFRVTPGNSSIEARARR